MALIQETGAGVANANTYASLDYVDTYCEDMGLTAWTALTETEKEAAILRGMAYIESFSFKGVKCEYDQALKWPRDGVYDEDGYALDNDVIPPRLKRALARAAYEEITAGTLQATLDGGVKREKVDVIEVEYFASSTQAGKIFTAIKGYLDGILLNENIVQRT